MDPVEDSNTEEVMRSELVVGVELVFGVVAAGGVADVVGVVLVVGVALVDEVLVVGVAVTVGVVLVVFTLVEVGLDEVVDLSDPDPDPPPLRLGMLLPGCWLVAYPPPFPRRVHSFPPVPPGGLSYRTY
ncbi:hypothetical protein B0I74DRAFT_132440, partial [Yarrowia lipolytica]